jgi:hypothetical protein
VGRTADILTRAVPDMVRATGFDRDHRRFFSKTFTINPNSLRLRYFLLKSRAAEPIPAGGPVFPYFGPWSIF